MLMHFCKFCHNFMYLLYLIVLVRKKKTWSQMSLPLFYSWKTNYQFDSDVLFRDTILSKFHSVYWHGYSLFSLYASLCARVGTKTRLFAYCLESSTSHRNKYFRPAILWHNMHMLVRNHIWAAPWQNQQNGLCAERRLRSAWASGQSDQSSLCAFWIAEDPGFLHADSKDSDQTVRMHRMIRVFDRRKGQFVGFVVRRLI